MFKECVAEWCRLGKEIMQGLFPGSQDHWRPCTYSL